MSLRYYPNPDLELSLSSIPAKGSRALMVFHNLRDQLVDEWQSRKADDTRFTPQDNPISYMKRQSYRIICHYLEKGSARFFEYAVRTEGRSLPSTVKLEENPFHYGLLALFSDDRLLSRQDRSFFAAQMLYAYRHAVAPEHLVGFLYQVGSNVELRNKIKEGYIEAGFFHVYRKVDFK